MQLYQDNVVNQYEDYLTGYYQTIKDKAGPIELLKERGYKRHDRLSSNNFGKVVVKQIIKKMNQALIKHRMQKTYEPKPISFEEEKIFQQGDLVSSCDKFS